MKIVIDIPEEAYELLKNGGVDWLGAEHILNAVANGTPVPTDAVDRVTIKEYLDSFDKDTNEKELCEDCISRQKAIETIDALYLDGDSSASYRADAEGDCLIGKYQTITALDDLPPVTPHPKMGRWIFHEPFDNGHKNCNACIECSQCHTWLDHDCYAKTPYCPICSTKMQVDQV